MSKRPMPGIVAPLTTTNDKIRALLREGYLRTEVAGFLDIRYQHVRKVALDAGIAGGLLDGSVKLTKEERLPVVGSDTVSGTQVEVRRSHSLPEALPADATTDWFWEGNVVEAIVRDLLSRGWSLWGRPTPALKSAESTSTR